MENNGIQPSEPTAPQQPVVDAQSPQPAPAPVAGWPSAAPPPAAGVGSGAPAPGVAPVVAPTSAPAPGLAPAPAAWGAPAAPTPTPTSAPVAPATPPVASSPAPELTPAPVPTTGEVAAAPEAPAPIVDGHNQEKPADDHNPMAIPAGAKAKRKAPVGVIVGAIVVAILLAGAAVFAYMKMQKPATSKSNQPVVTTSDVDNAQKEIDSSLAGVDDAKDFEPSTLSDSALGL